MPSQHKPQRCDLCGSPTAFCHALDVYGRFLEGWEWFICCTSQDCRAFVETKPGTNRAAAGMSTSATRQARKLAHEVFDPLWLPDRRRRKLAYRWLQRMMNLSEKECHILKFDTAQCYQVIRLVQQYQPRLEETQNVRR